MDREIHGGEQWWREIIRTIQEADVFVFALSQDSWTSQPCRDELDYAQKLGLPILPVQVGSVESVRIPIMETQGIDYRERTANAALGLVAALTELTSRPATRTDPPPEPPKVPFEYLYRIAEILGPTPIAPDRQEAVIAQLRRKLKEERDVVARADIVKLLREFRRRKELTVGNSEEIDQLLEGVEAAGLTEQEDGATRLPPTDHWRRNLAAWGTSAKAAETPPVEPGGPAEPDGPGGPAESAHPSGSAGSVRPGGPTKPARPSGSAGSAGPSGSTEPARHSGSAGSAGPGGPAGSVRPGGSDGSTKPVTPTRPTPRKPPPSQSPPSQPPKSEAEPESGYHWHRTPEPPGPPEPAGTGGTSTPPSWLGNVIRAGHETPAAPPPSTPRPSTPRPATTDWWSTPKSEAEEPEEAPDPPSNDGRLAFAGGVLGAMGVPFGVAALAAQDHTATQVALSLLVIVSVLGLSLGLVSVNRGERRSGVAVAVAAVGLLGAVLFAFTSF